MLDVELNEGDVRLLIDAVNRQLEIMRANYAGLPLPLVSIKLKNIVAKLETKLGKVLTEG